MEYEEFDEDKFDVGEFGMAVYETKERFIGLCDKCGNDVDEEDGILCPECGAVYHEWCVKRLCARCRSEMEEAI